MKFLLKSIVVGVIAVLFSFTTWAQKINSAKSYVTFNVSKLGFSNVNGKFSGMEGTLIFNPDDMSKNTFNVCIKAATVTTGEADRDTHLREKDFFHSKKYPNICFQSKSMLKTKNGYLTTGTVTIKGKSKVVNVPFTYANNTFKGSMKLNRKDFNLNDGTGMFVIGEMIEIEIVCVRD